MELIKVVNAEKYKKKNLNMESRLKLMRTTELKRPLWGRWWSIIFVGPPKNRLRFASIKGRSKTQG